MPRVTRASARAAKDAETRHVEEDPVPPLPLPPPQPDAMAVPTTGLYLSPSKLMALSALLTVLQTNGQMAFKAITGSGTPSSDGGVSAVDAPHLPAPGRGSSITRCDREEATSKSSKAASNFEDETDFLAKNSPSPPHRRCHQKHDNTPRMPFNGKQLFLGTLDEDVNQDETQATLARLTEDDKLLLLLTCLADKTSRLYHAEKRSNGPFDTYEELLSAVMGRFTPTQAERKTQKLKLKAFCQKDTESVIKFKVSLRQGQGQGHICGLSQTTAP